VLASPEKGRKFLNETGKGTAREMSDEFSYIHLKFVPKIIILTEPILRQREVVVEVLKSLVQLRQSEALGENPGEEAIALDLARRAALGTFPSVAERILGLYDEGIPISCNRPHHVMDERACDHEKNGGRRGGSFRNSDVPREEPLSCVLVRSGQEPIVVNLEIAPAEPCRAPGGSLLG
jgi:hypothetical protein